MWAVIQRWPVLCGGGPACCYVASSGGWIGQPSIDTMAATIVTSAIAAHATLKM
jgi:hypothetical protein